MNFGKIFFFLIDMSVEKLFKESFQIDGFSGILQNMKNLNDKFFPLQIIIIIIFFFFKGEPLQVSCLIIIATL